MIPLLLALWGTASAVNVNVRVCVEHDTLYGDNGTHVGDDFLVNDGPVKARGTRVVVRTTTFPLLTIYDDFTSTAGATQGCTPQIAMTQGANYTVTVRAWAGVNGNFIKVWDDVAGVPPTENLEKAGSNTPLPHSVATTINADQNSVKLITTPVDEPWSILVVAEQALHRENGGKTGNTYRFKYAPSESSGSEHVERGRVRMGANTTLGNSQVALKYLIAHEMGHSIQYFGRGGTESTDVRSENSPAMPIYNDACITLPLGSYSQSTWASGHTIDSREYQSVAWHEGFAHYYAALAFNDNSLSNAGCRFVPYRQADWNVNGTWSSSQDLCDDGQTNGSAATGGWPAGTSCYRPEIEHTSADGSELGDVEPFTSYLDIPASCEGAPVIAPPSWYTPRAPGNDHRAYCDGLSLGPLSIETQMNSTEYDWVRFLWDLNTDGGMPVSTLMQAYTLADPPTWLADEATAAEIAANPGLAFTYPTVRFEIGLQTLDAQNNTQWTDAWETWGTFNGIRP